MFGFTLSRGVDIDKNGYKDLAVGAPNSEKVYIFKTYPIIQIKPSVNSTRKTFYFHDTQVNLSVCFVFNRKVVINFTVEIDFSLSADLENRLLNRTSFNRDFNETILTINKTVNITAAQKCWDYVVFIKPSLSKKPIKFEMTYELAKKISQNDTAFCEDCVITELKENKLVKYEILFVGACASCRSDLEVTATVINVT